MLACQGGHIETAMKLNEVAGGLDLQDKQGRSSLAIASSQGKIEMVDALLGAGAKAELVDEDGRSSLMLALQGGHIENAIFGSQDNQ